MKAPEPTTLEEALRRPDADLWWDAWLKERGQMDQYGVYEEVPEPKGVNIVGSKIVFKVKKNPDGSIERYKCRLVARGFTQRYGCDFRETFAPVASSTTVRLFLAVCTQMGFEVRQLDITAAYLQGELKEHTIYMRPPKGSAPEGKVWKLLKSVYGLKQAGLVWGRKLSTYLINDLKFTRCPADPCLFMKDTQGGVIYVCSYVDDCIYAGNSTRMLDEFRNALKKKFGIRDLKEPTWFLGLNVEYDQNGGTLKLHQSSYILEAGKKYGVVSSHTYKTPFDPNMTFDEPKEGEELSKEKQELYMRLIGTLNYAATQTRPDISVNVSVLSQFMARASEAHLKAAFRVLMYLYRTHNEGITYKRVGGLLGFSDASFAPNGKTGTGWRRSRSGGLFIYAEGAVSWFSKNQTCVALSTAEAEYIALSLATQEAVWLRKMLSFLGHHQDGPTTIYEDNQAAQVIATTEMDSKRSKHIDVRYHYTREKCLEGIVKIVWCSTESMIADMLTKSLDVTKLQKFWSAARGDTKIDMSLGTRDRNGKLVKLVMVGQEKEGLFNWRVSLF